MKGWCSQPVLYLGTFSLTKSFSVFLSLALQISSTRSCVVCGFSLSWFVFVAVRLVFCFSGGRSPLPCFSHSVWFLK